MKPHELLRCVSPRIPPGPVTVALSGGADSAVLAWCLSHRGDVAALTVDHGLPDSPRLAAAAGTIAAQLGIPHSVVAVVPRSGSEADLRIVRRAALETHTTGWIATAHTADDQAETVLGNLLRGAGAAGLAGIPARQGRFVRPMLDIPRETTRSVAAQLGLPFFDDPQNDDLAVRRNRLRALTLPGLTADYNPRLRDALLRTARAIAADDEALEGRAALVPLQRDEEAVLVPAAALTQLPVAVAARVAHRALRLLLGEHAGDAAAVAGVLAAAAGGPGTTVRGGLRVRREGPWLAVSGMPPVPPAPAALAVPGLVPFGSWTIESGRGGVVVPSAGPFVVRAARPGDRISIGRGTKAVADALREAAIPVRLRSRWPVVESHGRIAWVVGVRVAPSDGGEVVAMTARRERR